MKGINNLKERIIILDGAKMDYTPREIERFIEQWNEGYHIGDLAEKNWISQYEVALLMMHCEIEGWIQPRPGGLRGTIPRRKQRSKMEREKKGISEIVYRSM
ncbi:hypothetical protein ACT8ZR_09130 [Neobacillus sp. M.A.Huq-85]